MIAPLTLTLSPRGEGEEGGAVNVDEINLMKW